MFWYGVLKPANYAGSRWFQNGGSIAVVLGVLAEFLLQKLNDYPTLTGSISTTLVRPIDKLRPIYSFTRYFGILLIILGTFVWGFGGDVHLRFAGKHEPC